MIGQKRTRKLQRSPAQIRAARASSERARATMEIYRCPICGQMRPTSRGPGTGPGACPKCGPEPIY